MPLTRRVAVGPCPTPNVGPWISGFGGVGPSVVLGVGPCLARVDPSFYGFGVLVLVFVGPCFTR